MLRYKNLKQMGSCELVHCDHRLNLTACTFTNLDWTFIFRVSKRMVYSTLKFIPFYVPLSPEVLWLKESDGFLIRTLAQTNDPQAENYFTSVGSSLCSLPNERESPSSLADPVESTLSNTTFFISQFCITLYPTYIRLKTWNSDLEKLNRIPLSLCLSIQ